MKKVLGLVGCCIGFLLLILGSVMKMKEHTTVCIIGGADGPTSIFLAGNLGGDLSISFILTGIAVLIIIVICYLEENIKVVRNSNLEN